MLSFLFFQTVTVASTGWIVLRRVEKDVREVHVMPQTVPVSVYLLETASLQKRLNSVKDNNICDMGSLPLGDFWWREASKVQHRFTVSICLLRQTIWLSQHNCIFGSWPVTYVTYLKCREHLQLFVVVVFQLWSINSQRLWTSAQWHTLASGKPFHS